MSPEAVAESPPKFVTRSEFARLRGYAASYVNKLMRAGRLVLSADTMMVDVEASIARIDATAERPVAHVSTRTDRARKDFYDAEVARLDLEERVGKLMRAEDVLGAIADAGAMFAARLAEMPDQLAPHLAAMGADEARIRSALATALDGARADMAAKLRGIGSEVTSARRRKKGAA